MPVCRSICDCNARKSKVARMLLACRPLPRYLSGLYFLGGPARTLRRWRGSDMLANSTGGSLAAASRRAYQADSGMADKPCATTLSRIVQVAVATSVSTGRLTSVNLSTAINVKITEASPRGPNQPISATACRALVPRPSTWITTPTTSSWAATALRT